MACYIVFGGFHNDFQSNFISAPLELAPPLSSKNFISARALFRENTVVTYTFLFSLFSCLNY